MIRKFDTVPTRPGARRSKKTMIRQTHLSKLQQISDETNPLADLARHANTNMNLLIGTSTIQHGFM